MSLYVRYQPIALGGSGGGGVTSIGPFGTTPNSAGGDITGSVLTLEPADGTHPGGVSILAQTFGGNKTFLGSISAANLSGTNTGDVTIGTANGLSLSGQILSLALSSTSTTGALSSTDWNTFNGKQPSGNYITALTGDATATGPGSAVLTLATVNSNVGTFGAASNASVFTVNAKGLITAATDTPIQIAESQVTNLVADLASKVATSSLGNLTDTGTDGITVTGGTAAVIGSVSLSQHVADTTHNGYLSSTDWNTFNSKQSALTLGNLTDAGTDGITVTGGTGAVVGSGTSIAQHVADTTHNGYLSSTDWNTFNGKGAGTVTSVSVTTANGVSGSVATATTTPAITLSLGAITPTTVNGNTLTTGTGTLTLNTFTLSVNATSSISGGNTGDLFLADVDFSGVPNSQGMNIVGQRLNLNSFNGTHPGVVSASGGGSVNFLRSDNGWSPPVVLGAVGSSPNANGATFGAGQAFNLQPFDGTHPGVVTASGGGTTNFLRADGTWAATTPSFTIVSKTANYNIATSDYTILGNTNGGAFALTLPDATTSSGAIFIVVYTGTAYANALTLNTTSSQTIAGSLTTTLNTPNERLQVQSDGSNWQILSRTWDSTCYTFNVTINGSSSNPSVGTVAQRNTWQRVGDSMFINVSFFQTSAGSAGSGTYQFVIPNGLACDTSKISNAGGLQGIVGFGKASGNADTFGSGSRECLVSLDNTTTSVALYALTDGSSTFLQVGSGNFSLGNTVASYCFEAKIPISGWKGL